MNQDLEDEEGVWVMIFSVCGLIVWPGKYHKEKNTTTLFCEDILGQYRILSVLTLNLLDSDVIVSVIPDSLKDLWKEAYVKALNCTKDDVIMKHVFGTEPKTVVGQIDAENRKNAPNLNSTTLSFLAKGLVSLKSRVFFESNEEMFSLEKNMAKVFANDKIENKQDLIQFSKELFESLNKKQPKKILSPLFSLRNLYFTETSEMNFQEALSIIFSYMVGTTNGQLTSSINVRENGLSKQARLSKYFSQKYFLPDKILTKTNVFQDLEEQNQFDWRFFFGEWKPIEIESIYDHPDFKKVVLLMRGSLKELMFELLERELLYSYTELEAFGSLSSGTKICFLRLIMTPKISNIESYSYTFRLYNTKWYNFTTPEEISKVMSIVVQIGKCALDLQFKHNNESGERIQTICDTPKSSKSVNDPGLYEFTCSNIVCDIMNQNDFYLFSSHEEALDLFSTLLNCKLVKNDVVNRYSTSTYEIGCVQGTYRTRIYLKKDALETNYCIHFYQRGSQCIHPTNEIEIIFKLKAKQNRIESHILKVSISTIELLNSVRHSSARDDFDEDGDDNDSDDNGDGSDNNGDENGSSIILDQEIHKSLGSNFKIELETPKVVLGTMNFKNKESFFKITKTKNENIQVMEMVKEFSSPNICEILFYGPVQNKLHLTIQEKLLNYESIMENLLYNSNKQKSIRAIVLKVFIGCLRGLEYLHEHNVVHCDISVNNIMFRKKNEDDFEAVLIDFNNSKFLESQESSIVNYKEEYSPLDPELRFTVLHDIYSVSVVIKKLLVKYSKVREKEILSDVQFVEFDVLPLAPLVKKMSTFGYTNVNQVLNDLDMATLV